MGIKVVKQEDGFTIVELSLFFAVSAMLLFILMVGVTLTVQRQRFSDSVHSTQSFLQQQYNETQTTINNRDSSPCGTAVNRGTSDCLVLGKIVDLQAPVSAEGDNTVRSYDVIANATLPTNAGSLDDITLLNQIDPTAVREVNNDQEYIVAWGAQLRDVRDTGGDEDPAASTPTRYVLMLRSPLSGLLQSYKLSDTSDMFSTGIDTEQLTGRVVAFSGTSNQSVKACISSVDIVGVNALLEIGQSGSQDGVTTQFDTEEARLWCA